MCVVALFLMCLQIWISLGDEMTFHVCQTSGGRRETGSLIGVVHHQTTPQSGRPIVGVFQDALVSAYKLTQQDVHLSESQYQHYVGTTKYWNQSVVAQPAIMEFDPDTNEWKSTWTGKQLMSEILPPVDYHQLAYNNPELSAKGDYVTYSNPLRPFHNSSVTVSNTHDVVASELKRRAELTNELINDRRVIIRSGHLMTGRADSTVLSNKPNSLGHVILHALGDEINARFLSDIQRMNNEYLTNNGLSIGVTDCDFDEEEWARKRVEQFVAHINNHPDLQECPDDTPTMKHMKESVRCRLVAELRTNIGGIIRAFHADASNPIINRQQEIINAGSKASITHLTQALGMFGQTMLDGKRMEPRFKDSTLPYFPPGTRTLESLGLIINSFIRGLNIRELLFQAADGREGVISTGQFTQRQRLTDLDVIRALITRVVHGRKTIE